MYAKILTVLTPRRGVGREKDFPQVIFFPFCLATCSAISICDSCQRVKEKKFFLIIIYIYIFNIFIGV